MKNLILWIILTTSVFSQSYNFTTHSKNDISQLTSILPGKVNISHPMFVKTLNFPHSVALEKYNAASRYPDHILMLKDNFSGQGKKHFFAVHKRKMLEKGIAGSIIVGLFGAAAGGILGNARTGITTGSTIGSTLGFLDYKNSYDHNISFIKILLGSVLGGTAAYFLLTPSQNVGVATFKIFGAFVLPPLGAYIMVSL